MQLELIKLGSSGPNVEIWQNFLVGQSYYWIEATGNFDEPTKEATELFQKEHGLVDDGVVSSKTYGVAISLGLSVVTDSSGEENGPDWPLAPSNVKTISYQERENIFGKFSYSPTSNGNIIITDNWATENIKPVTVPQFAKFNQSQKILFHKKGEDQLISLWKDWEKAGLLDKILTFDGSWVPRFVRGSTTYLSNHAWGTAFDINAQWNALGVIPALKSKKGSVRELVEIANKNGFYWGGHFSRRDGMHFELGKSILISTQS